MFFPTSMDLLNPKGHYLKVGSDIKVDDTVHTKII